MTENLNAMTQDLEERARIMIRAAAWVSKMDLSGGADSDSLEQKAILDNLHKFKMEKDYVLLIPVFDYLITHYKGWDTLTKDLSDFLGDLRNVAPDAPLVFRQCVYDLAYCVATRYRERNWFMAIFASIHMSLRNFLIPGSHYPELPEYLNISVLEKSALNDIAAIFGLPQRLID